MKQPTTKIILQKGDFEIIDYTVDTVIHYKCNHYVRCYLHVFSGEQVYELHGKCVEVDKALPGQINVCPDCVERLKLQDHYSPHIKDIREEQRKKMKAGK